MAGFSHTNADGTRTVFVDNEDGTGTLTSYSASGDVTQTENLTGLPLPPEPTEAQVNASHARAALSELATLQDGLDAFRSAYQAAGTNTSKQTVILNQYGGVLSGLDRLLELMENVIRAVVKD